MKFNYKLGVVGYGNMASCIIARALMAGVVDKAELLICDADQNKISNLGISYTTRCEDISQCEYILLAVKPQSATEVLKRFTSNGSIIISIMAGIKTKKISDAQKNAHVVRVMPNTPSLVGLGAMGVNFNGLEASKCQFITEILESNGIVELVTEQQINAVTAVSGSGPAYIYYFIKSLIEGGTSKGLSYDVAKNLTVQTVLGAAKMVRESPDDIDTLIERVCSKGGTTIEAINSFEENQLSKTIQIGMDKCFSRACEMEELF